MSKELSAHDLAAREARRAVATAIRHGELERNPCMECGAPAEAHHHLGYEPEHWLDIEWLCRPHHSHRHFAGHQQWSAIKVQKGVPLSLREIRHLHRVTQVELAARLGIAQGNVAMFEGRKDVSISKLRRYVEALGGKLELTAVFDEDRRPLAIG